MKHSDLMWKNALALPLNVLIKNQHCTAAVSVFYNLNNKFGNNWVAFFQTPASILWQEMTSFCMVIVTPLLYFIPLTVYVIILVLIYILLCFLP